MPTDIPQHRTNRRRFLAAGTTASLAAGSMVHSSAVAAETAGELRLGVIGCGGRGRAAIRDSFSVNENIKLTAVADLSPEACRRLVAGTTKTFPEKVAVEQDKQHAGLDAYKRILDDPSIDLVLLTTSPGFRPLMLKEAVTAGKHVFAEKPVCVDAVGYQTCLAAHEQAAQQGTAIVTGTQYRRQVNYIAAIEQIRQGAIGEVINVTARYCTGPIWYKPRKEGMTSAQYQLYNWMHFIWLSGDQICEQAVHNIDTFNWVMNANPLSAYGSGGRFTRPEDSEMWDSMAVDYDYPEGRTVSFMCRQIPGSQSANDNVVYGTEGTCQIGAANAGSRIFDRKGAKIWEMGGKISDAYQQEHKDLVDSIRAGSPIVELKQTADSSMVAILGRVAAYTGKRVTWEFMTEKSQLDLFPKDLAWDGALQSPGFAVPGKTKLI